MHTSERGRDKVAKTYGISFHFSRSRDDYFAYFSSWSLSYAMAEGYLRVFLLGETY